MNLSAEKIKRIAEELDFGWVCFLHKKTKKVITMPEPYSDYSSDFESEFPEIAEEIEENFLDYIKIEKMSSRESFQFMEDFVEERVEDIRIKNRLINALSQRKPFRRFKNVLFDYDGALKIWSEYKIMRIGQWVKAYLENYKEFL